jgi:hypothetical protein
MDCTLKACGETEAGRTCLPHAFSVQSRMSPFSQGVALG